MHISAPDLRGQLARARAEFPFIDAVEDEHGLPDYLLYAVGSRETNLRNIAGDFSQRSGESSPRFHGFGIWQRDSGAFGVDESYLDDVVAQADDAAALLAAHFDRFDRWDAAVAAYNAGAGAVAKALRKGKACDSVTTGGDYSADVMARRSFLERDRNGAGAHELVGLDGAVYLVKAGDTLSGIAARFHTTVAALVAANNLDDPDVIDRKSTRLNSSHSSSSYAVFCLKKKKKNKYQNKNLTTRNITKKKIFVRSTEKGQIK